MRAFVDFEQMRLVDGGVAPRRREGRVAEKFLDRAQVSAGGKQMRRERVAQPARWSSVIWEQNEL